MFSAPASASQPAPAAGSAGFSFGATAASVAAAATTAVPQQTSTSGAPAAVSTGAAASASAPAPAVPAAPTYATLLSKACRDGVAGDALVQAIKKRFAAPMEVTVPTVTPTTAASGAMAGAPSAVTTALQAASSWLSASAPQAGTASPTFTLARSTEPQVQQERRRLQAEQASQFLQTLLLCDSGYNNSEAPPADHAASSQWADAGEAVQGLHAAVAGVAVAAAGNLIAFMKATITAHNQTGDGEATASSLFRDSRGRQPNEHPMLMPAQCLFVLSRHFQLPASVVKEALELMDPLYLLLKLSLQRRVVAVSAFSDGADTASLGTLMWLCVFSVVNMVAVWKRLRGASGALQLNELVQSNVATSIEAAVAGLRRKLRESVQASASSSLGARLYHSGGAEPLLGGGRGVTGAILRGAGGSGGGSAAGTVLCTWQVLMDSYLSILTLAEGCLLRAKGSELGYDKALDAFLGERVAPLGASAAAAAPSSGSAAASSGTAIGVTVHRGKVTKRMVELAPVPRTLSIPVGLVYIAPYEMMSYLFDEMLPLIRHLSELEVATHRRYGEQLEELPRLPSFGRADGGTAGASRASTGDAVLDAYYGIPTAQRGVGVAGGRRSATTEAEEAWLRRVSRSGPGGDVVGEPFTSEMAHLLGALATCLQHLPPEVLNPDLDADCAATFFIFKNFVKHMRVVFAAQRSGGGGGASAGGGVVMDGVGSGTGGAGAVWENYTLKLVTKFLEVLAMIGRNPQYMERVVVLLTDAQSECGEMQWPRLVAQALDCAGFNSAAWGGDGASAAALATTAPPSAPTESDDFYALLAAVPGANGAPRVLHRQFTRAYARKCQRRYISGFFLLLRQLFTHPTLRPVVSSYMNLALALTFLSAPQQSQVMLGSTLSLVSALVTSAADAQLVWAFLDQRRLLVQSSVRSQQESNTAGLEQDGTRASTSVTAAATATAVREEALSLIGHCQYECRQGTYDITVGFLNLVTALFQHDQPTTAALPVYNTVTHFIAQEVVRGVSKRVFVRPHERYTVVALASAALRQALLVRFRSGSNSSSGGASMSSGVASPTTTLPFAVIMAINKAPTDVVGELTKIILDASDSPHELLGHHRSAVRQALRLLITAIETVRQQRLDLLLFDSRTTHSTELAVRVLGLCSLQDTLLTRTTLQLLLLFPYETANQAAHYWAGLEHRYDAVLDAFTQLLHPTTVAPAIVQAPPELAQLDFEPSELVPGWMSAVLCDTKSLLLDLLMQHADVTEPSLAAWVCGFYGEEFSRRDRRGQPAVRDVVDGAGYGVLGHEPRWWHATLLTSVVEGACSHEVENRHPALAVKYVKLLYLLRANRLYGSLVVRPFLESVCQTLFLRLQHFCASRCTPVALSKYAYVLKLLALEACYTFRTAPDSLRLAQNTSITSIAVEVLLSLLHPFRGAGGGADAAGVEDSGVRSLYAVDGAQMPGKTPNRSFAGGRDHGDMDVRGSADDGVAIMSRDAAVDVTSWLPEALQVLPTFPSHLPVVEGGQSHLVPCAADGATQYDMTSLYAAMQAEHARAGRPPMTMAELRERLRPFIVANDCFFAYASGVSFVEGWCQLVSVSCSVVRGLSVSRLRSFAVCILRGLDATSRLTAAAQEQVAVRLCHCLSTVMAHLRQTVCTALASSHSPTFSAAAAAAAADDAEAAAGPAPWQGDYPGVQTRDAVAGASVGYARGGSASAAAAAAAAYPQLPAAAGPSSHDTGRLPGDRNQGGAEQPRTIGQHRPREDRFPPRRDGSWVAAPTSRKSFATDAGEASAFFGAANRAHLAQALLLRRQAASDAISAVVEGSGLDAAAATASWLLEPLVRAVVQWGAHVPAARSELYLSLLCLAETPGVCVDDAAVWRHQRALLDLLVSDICNSGVGGPHGAAASVSGTAASVHLSVGSTMAGGGGGGGVANPSVGLNPQAHQAVALLVSLLQASAAMREEFCRCETGNDVSLGTSAQRCAAALLQSVDAAVCAFFASSGAQFGSLLWQLRSAFDVVSVVSLNHGSQVLHSDLLQQCLTIRAWEYSTQVVLGYTQAVPAYEPVPGRALVEQNKEVLRRLLLGVVRWVNLLLSTFGDAAPLLYEVQTFIAGHRQLIDHVFVAPASVGVSAGGAPATRLSASHLSLCAELSDCLRALSCSVLAVDCRELVEQMALAELLSMLSSRDVWHRGAADLYDGVDDVGIEEALGGAALGGSAAAAGSGGGAERVDGVVGSDAAKGTLATVAAGGGVAARVSSAAERGRDVVALTVRNLAHLLLNAEYGQRDSVRPVDAGSTSSGPMLRHSASKRQLVVQSVRQVAQSLVQAGSHEVHEFRLECCVYALHALVCLLHSFVLPLSTAGVEFVRYLSELPLADVEDALRQAQAAVNQLRDFSSDYRGGIRASQVAANAWAIGASGVGTRSQMLSRGDAQHAAHPTNAITAGGGGSSNTSNVDSFSVPSTPGLLPKPESRSKAAAAAPPAPAPAATLPPSAGAPRTGSAHGRDPNLTVSFHLDGAAPPASTRPSPLLPATDDGAMLDSGVTLRDLMPQGRPAGSGPAAEWTRLYDSSAAHDVPGTVAEGDLDSTGVRAAPLQWADVLNVENEVRQVKIAIANALRATKAAKSLLRSPS